MAEPNGRRTSPRKKPNNSPSFLGKPKPGEGPGASQDDVAAEPQGARVEMLDPKIITWPEGRITSEYDEEKAAALRQSMTELGQQDAVGVVEMEDGTYEGSAGMNRCMAAIQSGAAEILCVVRRGTHRDVVKGNLATSINQSRANPLSEVEGIAHAFQDEGFDVEELVGITGKSTAWINDRLEISQSSPAVKQCLEEGQIAIGHAALLARVEDPTVQEEMLSLQLRNGWTIGQLEEQLRGDQSGTDSTTTTRARNAGNRGPVACHYCKEEHGPAEVQKVSVCSGCASKVLPAPVGDGEVAVQVELLREAEAVLAGTQAGAGLAERISALVEI